MTTVHVVVPAGIDDEARPSGGNVYDRRICRGLVDAGWEVREHHVAGCWPWPDTEATDGLRRATAGIPDDAVVLIDGLIALTAPGVLVPESERLAFVVLVHLPLGDRPAGHGVDDARVNEFAVLSAATAIVTTSAWTRERLLDMYPLRPDLVQVAEPGTDTAELAPGTPDGGRLLCVAAVTPHKGHDILVDALASAADLPWHCTWVGALDRDPEFVETLRRTTQAARIDERFRLTGALTGDELGLAYATADVLVLPSLAETYGMVVTEALARGLPVIATAVGGLPAALGSTADGVVPGLLVAPGDRASLAEALTRWLRDAVLRQHLRKAARERRTTVHGWPRTVDQLARVLITASAERSAPHIRTSRQGAPRHEATTWTFSPGL